VAVGRGQAAFCGPTIEGSEGIDRQRDGAACGQIQFHYRGIAVVHKRFAPGCVYADNLVL